MGKDLYEITLPISITSPVRLGRAELVKRLLLVAARNGLPVTADRLAKILNCKVVRAQVLIERACNRIRQEAALAAGGG